MNKKSIYIIIILILTTFVFFYFYSNKKTENICDFYQEKEILVNNTKIHVDVADNDCKRELGLSKIQYIVKEGMLFIFENSGNYNFWMKDMNFPIDILWIDQDYKIIGIKKSIATSTYPETFGSEYYSRYILELSSGFSDKNNIKIGDKIIFAK